MKFHVFLISIVLPVFVFALRDSKLYKETNRFNIPEPWKAAFSNQTSYPHDVLRIVGGEVARLQDFPWISMVWAFPPGDVFPLTNAAIVNKYFAVTSISSFAAVSGIDVKYALAFNTDTSGQLDTMLRGVREIITHQDHQGSSQYDIALVRVCPKIPSKFTVINLAPSSRFYRDGDTATYVAYSLGLKKGTKMVAEWCECERYPGWTMDQHLCLECSSDIYTDLQAVDYGTVIVVINNEVAGLVLKSSSNCEHNYGEMALNLARFRSWIDMHAVYDESM